MSDAPPWVRVLGEAIEGVEPALVRELAKQLDAKTQWVRAGPARLLAGLEAGELDLVIGGFTAELPGVSRFGATRVYRETRTLIASVDAGNVTIVLHGLRVAARPGDPAVARLRAEGAEVVTTEDPRASGEAFVATEDWRVPALGLRPTAVILARERHLLLGPAGENGWILTLDRFLATQGAVVEARLAAEAGQ